MTVSDVSDAGTHFWRLGRGAVEPSDLDAWTLPRIVNVRAKLEPENPVFRVKTESGFRTITWTDFRAEIAVIAAGLDTLGIERGGRVAILGDSSPLWVSFDIAVLALGGITVGIYPTSSIDEICDQLNHVAATVLIVLGYERTERLADAIGRCGALRHVIFFEPGKADDTKDAVRSVEQLLRVGSERIASEPDVFDTMSAKGQIDDPMRLFFTSGSTGKPKAVAHTQRSLVLSADAVIIRYPAMRLEPQRVLAFLPLSHISPVLNNILIPLITSAVAYFGTPDQDVPSLIRDVHPTYLALMPRHYQKLAAQLAERTQRFSRFRQALFRRALAIGGRAVHVHWSGRPVPTTLLIAQAVVRRLVFKPLLAEVGLAAVARAQTTSAAMPRDVATMWGIYGLDLREGYGSTEAPVVACQLDSFPEPGSIGRKMPRPWYEVKLAEDGEILIKSDTLFSGYWTDRDETERSKTDGWYKTGDIAEIDGTGNIHLIGRKKDIIITAGGKSLNPQDIEAPFRGSPYISEIVVLGEGKKFVAALIELSPEGITAWCREKGLGSPADYASMTQSDAVTRLISEEIEAGNQKLSRVAQIKQFRILPRALDVDKGEVTATRKIRRMVIAANFQYLVDAIYGSTEESVIAAQVAQPAHRGL